jgi:aspartate aminotransferase
MRKPLSSTAVALPSQSIVEIAQFAQTFDDVIPLWFGESDVPTPSFIIDAAHQAAASGDTFYPDVCGTPSLREAIARYESRLHGASIPPESVLVTASGMEALTTTIRGLVAAGDEVLVVRPAWQNVIAAVELAGGSVREVHLEFGADGSWSLPINRLKSAITPRTKCILLNSPNNPTGWIASDSVLEDLLDLCRQRMIWLVCDEVYERVVYSRVAEPSILKHRTDQDMIVSINSFSKAWAMTGWRLGWMIVPTDTVPAFERVKEYGTSGTNPFVQAGGVAALEHGEDFVRMFQSYCERGRDIVAEAFLAMTDVTAPKPESTFYQVFKVAGLAGGTSTCKRLIAEHGVGVAPCDMFGGGLDQWFRICFAQSPETLKAGMARLAIGVDRLRNRAGDGSQ